MQPEEAVKSAVEEFELQVIIFGWNSCLYSCLCAARNTSTKIKPVPCMQGADLTGIIKSAAGGNIDRHEPYFFPLYTPCIDTRH